eukprot:s12501_g1.t1
MHDIAKKLDYNQFKGLSSTGALDIAQYIFRLAVETGEKPLFVHFDEIGDLQANGKEVREAVRRVWELMLQYAGDMPRVYFYLSGKSVPLNATGGFGSPVGTKWIILDLLKELLPVLRSYQRRCNYGQEAVRAMEAVFEILKDQQAVASEVFLDQKDEAEWQQTWLYLILLAQLRVPCQRKTFLPVGSAEHSLDVLLGRLNV